MKNAGVIVTLYRSPHCLSVVYNKFIVHNANISLVSFERHFVAENARKSVGFSNLSKLQCMNRKIE